jgi:hypothetical protein
VSNVFLALVLLLLLYELVAFKRQNHETISEIFWRLSARPIVPFAMGVLMGHLFWQAAQ